MKTTEQLEAEVVALEARLRTAERTLAALTRLTVAPESGGGQIYLGADTAVLRINSLTTANTQFP